MSIADLARPEILRLKPYRTASGRRDAIRLHANESSWPDGDATSRYPEIRPAALTEHLAGWYGVDPENALVTRGSSEAIDLLIRTFCRAGQDHILVMPPAFGMYRLYADIHGAGVAKHALDAARGFAVDVPGVLDACTPETKLIFVCSPHNPAGQTVPRRDVIELLEARRNRSIVVVDEAYVEFSDEPSMGDLVESYDNLVVLRTTSKALALAGTRCGVAVAGQAIIGMLDRILPPYSMPTPTVQTVLAALTPERLAVAERQIAATVERRNSLAAQLAQLTIVEKVWPSDANFLLVRFQDAASVQRAAAESGILLRYFGDRDGLANCLRITVGSATEIDALMRFLKNPGDAANG